ncbi:MAG: S46 family peptidase, partial [Saprospiraceae bacterium]|nr:S46 family peptidase [Saprospiraceae bacterium]
MKFKFWMALSLFFVVLTVKAQKNQEPNPFDFGKMWTFENPPKDWFAKAYNFKPEDKWWDDVRKSSLRFATWCSASFISPDGLIMTNHHCSRDVVVDLQKEGENFDKQGFYATTMADERKAEGLFVEQLIQVADISAEVQKMTAGAEKGKEAEAAAKALKDIQEKYSKMAGWEGLRLQTV